MDDKIETPEEVYQSLNLAKLAVILKNTPKWKAHRIFKQVRKP
jgi:hypothetical protein